MGHGEDVAAPVGGVVPAAEGVQGGAWPLRRPFKAPREAGVLGETSTSMSSHRQAGKSILLRGGIQVERSLIPGSDNTGISLSISRTRYLDSTWNHFTN